MVRTLPPLNSLRAFEAAARHLSFTKAAEELNVTPAAVSQQVKALEDFAGVILFRRLTRALRLTDAGQASLPILRDGFDQLSNGYAAMRIEENARMLTVSVPPSFGAKWLVPRLDRFREQCPEFDIRIDATDALVNFELEEVDVAIRFGRGTYEGLHSECLVSDIAVPVCSPKLLDGPHPLREPSDLRFHTLLHVGWKTDDEVTPSWRMWLHAAGLDDIDASRGPRFNIGSLAVQAAIDAQGVVLGDGPLVGDDVAAGRLVHPFGEIGVQPTEFSYSLVYPEANLKRPKVAGFREWLLSEFQSETPATA